MSKRGSLTTRRTFTTRRGDATRRRILALVNQVWRSRYEPPGYKEIMAAVGVSSTSGMNYHVYRMLEQGMIIRSEKGKIIPVWVATAIKEAVYEQKVV